MISSKVLHRSDAGKSASYYTDQKDDYYASDGNAATWQGKGAELLGLKGEVSPERFNALLKGQFGDGVKPNRSVRMDAAARAGLDLTFSAPKSITLQALIGADKSVIEAHDKAVTAALNYVEEKLAQGRTKVKGRTYLENTGNLIVAKFRHETARPTEDSPPDPQLHTHAIIMNITRRKDGSWVALSNEKLFQMRKLIDAVYKSELANELRKAGHQLRYENNNVELAHISREQIETFSKRSRDIVEDLQRRGLSRSTASAEQKQLATLATRKSKPVELSRDELFQQWQREAKQAGMVFESGAHRADKDLTGPTNNKVSPGYETKDLGADDNSSPDDRAPNFVARNAVEWAVRHLSEREAILYEPELIAEALRHGGHYVTYKQVMKELQTQKDKGVLLTGEQMYASVKDNLAQPLTQKAWALTVERDHNLDPVAAMKVIEAAIVSGELQPTEPHYTTRKAYESEQAILAAEVRGRDAVRSMMPLEAVKAHLSDKGLTPGQVDAAELILSTQNRIVGVQGLAGVGKSHLLEQVKKTTEQKGFNMIALASYSTQVRALRELGVEARTIASFVNAVDKRRFTDKIDEKTVVVVDEAGVVPTRLLRKVIENMEAKGARVVLMGDTGQTKAIEAGRPFDQLQVAGMQTAWMKDIQRQKNPVLKRAVELAAAGKAAESLDYVESVAEVKDADKRYHAIAQRYVNLAVKERRDTLILTGTNASRNALNDAAHELMGLAGKGLHYSLLTRRDTTQAERRHAKYYVPGDVIQPERDYACGLKRGELYLVVGQTQGERNVLTVEHVGPDGERIDFAPWQVRKVSVYEPVRAELSVGDWVRVTRNNAELDLANGDRYEVVSVTPTHVTIEAQGRKVKLPAHEPLHLDRAYATTAHSAQGLTCDRVLINMESASRTTSRDVYYVGISRARHEAEIFTNDLGKLPGAISRRNEKTAALDITAQTPADQHQLGKPTPQFSKPTGPAPMERQ